MCLEPVAPYTASGERSPALPAAGAAPATPEAARPAGEKAAGRLAHLFRHTLRTGEVNPLLHIVPRHRGETLP